MNPFQVWRWLLAVVLLLSGCTPIVAPAAPATSTTPTSTPTATASETAPLTATTPTTATGNPVAQAPLAPIGESIDVGGRTLFLSCLGEQAPTVLLEAGLGADHTSWDKVQAAVAGFARVCSYDRAGLGYSAATTTPRTSADIVADLHQLLQNAGEEGPYILVGHSFGGLHVRLFAHDYPAEVLGVVLVDAVHEDWWERAAALLPPAAEDTPALQSFRQFITTAYADPAQTAEGIDIPATVKQLQAAGTLGDKPLLVLVAGRPMLDTSTLPADLTTKLNTLLQETLPAELTALSTQSLRITVDESGHNIPQEQPNVIVAAIRTLIDVLCPGGC